MNGNNCKHCSTYILGSSKNMNEHLVRCEAERPYVCDAMTDKRKCGRHFLSDRALNTHRGAFHTAEEKRSRYRCQHCSHGTDNPLAMVDHQRRCAHGDIRRRSRSRSRVPSMPRSVPAPLHHNDDDKDAVGLFHHDRTSSAHARQCATGIGGTSRRSPPPAGLSFARSDGSAGGLAGRMERGSSSNATTGGARCRSVSKSDGCGARTAAATPRAVAVAPTPRSRMDTADVDARRPSVLAAVVNDNADQAQLSRRQRQHDSLAFPDQVSISADSVNPNGNAALTEHGNYDVTVLMELYRLTANLDNKLDYVSAKLDDLLRNQAAASLMGGRG